MNKKYTDLIMHLEKVLDDSEVINNRDLTDILKMYKLELEKGNEYNLVCTKLTNAITLYLNSHNFKAPKLVLNLYNSLATAASSYRGFSSFINWF